MITALDLTTTPPRSPNEQMDGIVSLARALDKARAAANGTLGEYHFDCPHDKPLFAFLGVDAKTFQGKAAELDDAAFARWIQSDYLGKKTSADITVFNEERRAWRPDPGTESAIYFDQLRSQVAPNRTDVVTWFDLLDLDEKRAVAHAHG